MITNKTFRPILLCFVFGYSNAAPTTEKHFPVENWITFQDAYYKTECDRQTRNVEPTEQRKHTMSGIEFFCSCAPAGLKAYADSLTPENRGKTVSLSAFISLVNPSIEEKCLAAYVRSTIYASCLSSDFRLPEGVTDDRASFCQCVSTQARAVSDKSISDTATIAQAKLDNAAKAIDAGNFSKKFENSELITQILKKCGAQ
jgi:hypothetical protein